MIAPTSVVAPVARSTVSSEEVLTFVVHTYIVEVVPSHANPETVSPLGAAGERAPMTVLAASAVLSVNKLLALSPQYSCVKSLKAKSEPPMKLVKSTAPTEVRTSGALSVMKSRLALALSQAVS